MPPILQILFCNFSLTVFCVILFSFSISTLIVLYLIILHVFFLSALKIGVSYQALLLSVILFHGSFLSCQEDNGRHTLVLGVALGGVSPPP
jgi:hypothetical protein